MLSSSAGYLSLFSQQILQAIVNYPIWYYALARFPWLGLALSPAVTGPPIFRRKLMKHLRQFCVASILTVVLALSAFAGDIECGVVAPPPPPAASAMGDIECGLTDINGTQSIETASIDPVTDFTLNILQSMLALF
jgi:hypothetical protein